jgi:CHASE1-domain containing sensor protein
MDNFKTKIRSIIVFLIILFISLIAIYLILFLNQDKL